MLNSAIVVHAETVVSEYVQQRARGKFIRVFRDDFTGVGCGLFAVLLTLLKIRFDEVETEQIPMTNAHAPDHFRGLSTERVVPAFEIEKAAFRRSATQRPTSSAASFRLRSAPGIAEVRGV